MKKKLLNIIINIIIIILEIIGFIGAYKKRNLEMFLYYTQLSNIFLFISSILLLVYNIKNYSNNKKIPKIIGLIRYSAVVSVTITFIVVLTILSWMAPGGLIPLLIEGNMLYHHTICPILGILSFILIEEYNISDKYDVIRSLFFTIIYAIIFIILNYFRIVKGPYPFLLVHDQSIIMTFIWIILILGGSILISLLIRYFSNKKVIK